MKDGQRPFSFTQLSTMLGCGEKYRRLYMVENAPKNIVGVKAVFGKTWHSVMQYLYNDLIVCKQDGTEQDLKKLAEVALVTFHENFESGLKDGNVKPTKNDPDPAEIHAKADAMIPAFIQREMARFDPAFVELKVDFDLPGITPFTSYIDLITTDGTIVDFKVKLRRMNEGAEHRSRQLTLYALAFYQKFGKMPKSVGYFWCGWGRDEGVKKGTGSPQFSWLESKRGPGHFKRLTESVRRAMDLQEVGVYLPAPEDSFICSEECQFHESCPVRP